MARTPFGKSTTAAGNATASGALASADNAFFNITSLNSSNQSLNLNGMNQSVNGMTFNSEAGSFCGVDRVIFCPSPPHGCGAVREARQGPCRNARVARRIDFS
jgi:hypothetical protein